MNTTGLLKSAAALVALAICSACGGTLPFDSAQGRLTQDDMAGAPSAVALAARYVGKTLSVNGRLVTAARVSLSPLARHATILADRRRSRKKFEYIINDYGTYADIFDYPKTDRQIGTINNVGGQGCTNVLFGYGKETFWIVAGADQITEYKIPQKPIKTLSVPAGQPSSCAMNTSGDLAVGNLANGDIAIFMGARGSGTVMTTPLTAEFFDGYDDQGDLFADGFTSSSDFTLVELPKGSHKFQTVTTSNTVKFPGSVQWDGTYLTVLDQRANAIYQYTVRGTKATLRGTVSLNGSSDCAQTWIVTGLVYCADTGNSRGEVFEYPAGGSAIAILTGSFDLPLGVVAARK